MVDCRLHFAKVREDSAVPRTKVLDTTANEGDVKIRRLQALAVIRETGEKIQHLRFTAEDGGGKQ
jgi:hypothetical protein